MSKATRLVYQPLDAILERYGKQLNALGDGEARKVMARAMNYEGQRAFVQVKRALRQQTSITTAMINRSVRTKKVAHKGDGALEFAIIGTGRPLSLKRFGARQFAAGTKATVWGRRQMFESAFIGPRPGSVAQRLGGHVYVRSGAARLPIEKMYGPGIANELVKDQSAQAFDSSLTRILDQVGKQIAATLRGY